MALAMVLSWAIGTGFQAGTPGDADLPIMSSAAAQLNADQTKYPGKAVASFVVAKYQFPYSSGAKPAGNVEMKMYPFDALKNPHNGSNIAVTFYFGATTHSSLEKR